MTAFGSVICSQFPEDRMKYLGYLEAGVGLGLMCGPPLSSFVYGKLGFEWAF